MLVSEDNIDRIIKYERKTPNLIIIDWWLGNFCNYKCHYCFPFSNKGNRRVPPLDVFEHNLFYLISKIKENNLIPYFVLSGGEPTVYNEITKLLKILKDNNIGSYIVTNGSRTYNWWFKNQELIDSLNISYHTEYADKKHILNLAKLFQNNRNTISMMASPKKELFDRMIEAYNFFIENDITEYSNLNVKPLYSDKDVYNYTEEQLKFIKKNVMIRCKKNKTKTNYDKTSFGYDAKGNKYTAHSNVLLRINPDFTGWDCSIGREFISIDYSGNIRANCGEKIFKKPFNMYKDDLEYKNFELPEKTVKCTVGKCLCLGLYDVSKNKPT